eukprot:3980041-Lingulodinium_polyedra.AAC.1
MPADPFLAWKHKTPKELKAITGKAQWPSFSPQGTCTLWAQSALLRHCSKTGSWGQASESWQNLLFPLGTVFKSKASGSTLLSLGPTGGVALLAWDLKQTKVGKEEFWELECQPSKGSLVSWAIILDHRGASG